MRLSGDQLIVKAVVDELANWNEPVVVELLFRALFHEHACFERLVFSRFKQLLKHSSCVHLMDHDGILYCSLIGFADSQDVASKRFLAFRHLLVLFYAFSLPSIPAAFCFTMSRNRCGFMDYTISDFKLLLMANNKIFETVIHGDGTEWIHLNGGHVTLKRNRSEIESLYSDKMPDSECVQKEFALSSDTAQIG